MSNYGTSFAFRRAAGKSLDAEAILVPLLSKPEPPMELVARADALCGETVSRLLATRALRADVGQTVHGVDPRRKTRILLVSLGDSAKINAAEVRTAAASAARWIISEKLNRVAVLVDGLESCGVELAVAHWAQGMAIAGFRFAAYRQRDEKAPARVTVSLAGGEAGYVEHHMAAVREALVVADGVNYARRLAHEPPNILNPGTLVDEVRSLARARRLKLTVHDAAALRRLGMGGLLAVGAGSDQPPCLVQLEYAGARRARRRTVLVGKTITFDTGGYSIKPAENMDAMKMDMAGGAAVLGTLSAVSELKLPVNVVGLLAVAENAVSHKAYRPGDILRMASGKTVEVTNTDAEGRLVLADALWYAQEKLNPSELIDLATLTGGVRIALGTAAAGVMANDDELAAELGEAGRRTHERLWRLPLWEDYKELIRSSEADIKNSSGKREAHAIVGGMFLKEFVKPGTPWAHLDIAAVANLDGSQGMYSRGATGFGVRLLVDYLRARAG